MGVGHLRHDGPLAGLSQYYILVVGRASGYFGEDRSEFQQNVEDYHEFLQENYVALTHALVNLQRRRRSNPTDTLGEEVALTLVKETDAGIVVKGSRVLATLGPISD